jgi:ABC-type Fe3+ transport system permease subunit
LALSNFAVPAILQVKVYPAEVWLQFNTNLDAAAARKLSWPLFVAPLLLIAFARLPEFPWPRESSSDFSRAFRRQLGFPWLASIISLSTIVVLLGLVLPLAQLLITPRTWSEFIPALRAGIPAVTNSFVYAASAATIAVILGFLLAHVRWFGWLWLLFFVPGILLGISAVEAFNRPGLDWFSRTSMIVIALLIVRYLALPRSICRTALRAVDTTLVDAGRLDGAGGLALFRRIILPQIAPQIGAAAYLVYVLCLWDVETILMVIPPGGETLALRIFNLLHYGHNSHVNALCMLLLLVALAPLALFALWRFAATIRYPSQTEIPA